MVHVFQLVQLHIMLIQIQGNVPTPFHVGRYLELILQTHVKILVPMANLPIETLTDAMLVLKHA